MIPYPQKVTKDEKTFFFQKIRGCFNLPPLQPSFLFGCEFLGRFGRLTRRIQGRNRTSAFASFVAPRWILQTEAAQQKGGRGGFLVGFQRLAAVLFSPISVKGFSRFFVGSCFFVFAYWPSLKRTANAPENRQMVKEIPIGNQHFFWVRFVSFKDCTFPSCWYIQIYTR